MPKIFGINALGVLLAAIAMYFMGFIVYGLLATDIWMGARGYTEEMFEGAQGTGLYMGLGFVLEFVLAIGLAWLLSKQSNGSLGACVSIGLVAALLVGLPLTSYEYVYGLHHDVAGLIVDWGHRIATIVAGTAVLSFFKT